MTPERARKIAQACADSWYGGAAGLNLKEAITQGILEACQETEGDLVATRAERDSYRQDLAAARAMLREAREVVASRRQFQAGYPLPKHLQITPERADLARRIDAALAGEGNHG